MLSSDAPKQWLLSVLKTMDPVQIYSSGHDLFAASNRGLDKQNNPNQEGLSLAARV